MTFENAVAKREIPHNKQFLLLPHCLKLYSIIILSFTEIFHISNIKDVFNVCCRFVVCGKWFSGYMSLLLFTAVDKSGECNMTYHGVHVDITPPVAGLITSGPFYDMVTFLY